MPEFCNVSPHGLNHGQGESKLSNVQIYVLMDLTIDRTLLYVSIKKNLWIKPLPEFCDVYPHGLNHGQGENERSNVQINVLMDLTIDRTLLYVSIMKKFSMD